MQDNYMATCNMVKVLGLSFTKLLKCDFTDFVRVILRYEVSVLQSRSKLSIYAYFLGCEKFGSYNNETL